RALEWLVVKDNWLHESATFWKNAPEVKNGQVKPADIKTEIFFFPSAQIAEIEGSFTNTQRMLQWHYKAAEAPEDCRTDSWFTYQLGRRLKSLYKDSTAPRDDGFKRLVFDYEHADETERQRGPPDHVQPGLGRPRRQAVEREEEVGLVGRGAEEMGRPRCPRLQGGQATRGQGQPERDRPRSPPRRPALHHEARRRRLALRPER